MLRHYLTPPRAVMGVFFLQAAVLGNWFPRIPGAGAAMTAETRARGAS
jgi:hypothetical protein